MIKEDNASKPSSRPLFHPAFGSRPQEIIGRDAVIGDFLSGLEEPIGSQQRCTFFKGQRGMGKTALLIELAEQAAKLGFVTARVTAYEGMGQDIIETLQRNGSAFMDNKRKIQGFDAGALGFSFGLTFTQVTDQQYGFQTKLALICDRLAEVGKGVLILVDEARTSREMRQLAITYQHLVGEEKNIAIAMAGLPSSISSILNDSVLTFLNRARKEQLGLIGIPDIRNYYRKAFQSLGVSCPAPLLDQAAESTRGFPYMTQLVGYYLIKHAEDGSITPGGLKRAMADSSYDLEKNVIEPVMAPLSDNDMQFLIAMAKDGETTTTASLKERLNVGNSFIQPYRARLIEAGIIESPRTGKLEFAVPFLAEYLRGLSA